MFYQLNELPVTEVLPGFHARFVHSERMTFVYWTIDQAAQLPQHRHEHEQVCHVLEGEFELTIDGHSRVLTPGQVGVIPSQAMHSGRAITFCRVMDVFQPVRDDYQALAE